MTDEQRLHKMMADPGPAPVHDAHGWPVTVGARVRHERFGLGWVREVLASQPTHVVVVFDAGRNEIVPVKWLTGVPQDGDPYTAADNAVGQPAVGLGPITVAGVVHKPGIFIPDDSDQHLWVCRTCTDDVLMPAWPCDAVADAVGRRSIHTVSTASGGFSVGHFAEFDYAGEAIVGVVESIGPDGSLTLGCGPEGRWVMPVAECRPWGPPLGALPGDILTEADGRPAFRPGDRVKWVVDGVTNGNGTVRQYPYRDAFIRPTLALVHFDGDPEPLTALIQDLTLIPTNPAGPAPSSASPSGTGGNRPDVEGRHREAWHQLVEAWRGIELHPTSSNSAHMQRRYAEGALVMYLTLTGQDEDTVLPEIGRALDDLYGTDRDKRGVPC